MKPVNNPLLETWHLFRLDGLLPIFYWVYFFGLGLVLKYFPLKLIMPADQIFVSPVFWIYVGSIQLGFVICQFLTGISIKSVLMEGEINFFKVIEYFIYKLFPYLFLYMTVLMAALIVLTPLLILPLPKLLSVILYVFIFMFLLILQDWIPVFFIQSLGNPRMFFRWFVFLFRVVPAQFFSLFLGSISMHVMAFWVLVKLAMLPMVGFNFLVPILLGFFYTWKIGIWALYLNQIFDLRREA